MMKRKETYVRKSSPFPKGILRRSIRERKPIPKALLKGKTLPFLVKPFKKRSGKVGNISVDRERKAMGPGIRVSKSGRVYPENRINRSDSKKKRDGKW